LGRTADFSANGRAKIKSSLKIRKCLFKAVIIKKVVKIKWISIPTIQYGRQYKDKYPFNTQKLSFKKVKTWDREKAYCQICLFLFVTKSFPLLDQLTDFWSQFFPKDSVSCSPTAILIEINDIQNLVIWNKKFGIRD